MKKEKKSYTNPKAKIGDLVIVNHDNDHYHQVIVETAAWSNGHWFYCFISEEKNIKGYYLMEEHIIENLTHPL